MKHFLLTAALALGTAIASAEGTEEQAARVPLENYLKGHATGEGRYMSLAFHPDARMSFIRNGQYSNIPIEQFINGFSGKPAADETQRKRWIHRVDITGNSGIGVIILDYPTVKFTDYMSLLKVDGQWRIVHKSFMAEAKAK